jgi:hypothetical protein
MPTSSFRNDKGAALIEFCIILPVLLLLVFAIIDFGRLILARLIITNVTREGGSLASRELKLPDDLIKMLQSSASPLDLSKSGRICISNIEAGLTKANPLPVISVKLPKSQVCMGGLVVSSGINGSKNLGLTQKLYDHLVFNDTKKTADINSVTVVETFYKFTPITPLPNFITKLWAGDSAIIGSRAVFCATTGEQP